MAEVNQKPTYTGIEKYIFADTYNFFIKYKDITGTDKEWEDCIARAEEIRIKYKDYPLARTILNEVLHIIECEKNDLPIKACTGLSLKHEQWEELIKNGSITKYKL